MQIFYWLSKYMLYIIFLFALIEVYLFWRLRVHYTQLSTRLQDSLTNMLKGIDEIADKDSSRKIHDNIDVLLDSLKTVKLGSEKGQKKLRENIVKEDQKKLDKKNHDFDVHKNVVSSGVQIFPLLGILGTIMAIGNSVAGSNATTNIDVIVRAFIMAIDTTILGILFGIIFMVIDAVFQAKSNRLSEEIEKYRDITRFSRMEVGRPAQK
ncbi:MotA/TolQ/ExbB proton channel family protein [Myxococcota bacterium]|nr:MotA/TolQ/ExbB proton channel family protein [Myxococcota bacterium]MBU1535004.1 MotA/TolQ/ExbB proton channel family protein [Myxococcota bacterium]